MQLLFDHLRALKNHFAKKDAVMQHGVNLLKFPCLSTELMQAFAAILLQMMDRDVTKDDIDYIVMDLGKYVRGINHRHLLNEKKTIIIENDEQYIEYLLNLLSQ